jgi:ABC-type branched-subunit amino acid transport system substrate-binding protein
VAERRGLRSRRDLLRGAAALAALAVAGCARPGSGDEIRLAAIVSTTGVNAGFGQGTWRGIQTAASRVNEQGGIRGYPGKRLVARLYDTQSKPDVAAAQTYKAIREGAVAVIGCNQSDATLIVSQICERSSVPFVTSTDFDPKLTARGFHYFFQTTPLLEVHAREMLETCRTLGQESGRPARRLGILCDDTVIGSSAQAILEREGRALGYEVARSQAFPADVTDFAPYLAKLKDAGTELLLGFQTPQPAIQIVKTMRQQRFDPLGFGGLLGGQVTSEYSKELGENADYTFSSTPWSADLKIPGMPEAIDAYRRQWNEDVDSVRAAGYASVAVLWSALESSGVADPKRVRDGLASVDIASGDKSYIQLGGCRFDQRGYNTKAAVAIRQTLGGRAFTIAPQEVTSASQRPVWPKPPWR